jgi:hypothetical protein
VGGSIDASRVRAWIAPPAYWYRGVIQTKGGSPRERVPNLKNSCLAEMPYVAFPSSDILNREALARLAQW